MELTLNTLLILIGLGVAGALFLILLLVRKLGERRAKRRQRSAVHRAPTIPIMDLEELPPIEEVKQPLSWTVVILAPLLSFAVYVLVIFFILI
ncbi:MAG: hypothetical protein JXB38_19530 [Anaerolineales bacterium]|nr:hypothetical protein [Anaerolineales bacterium]